MQRVAIFGNAGGGKSTLARRLSRLTGLPLHALDVLQFRPGGTPVPQAEYEREHARIVAGERWIIDGYGCPRTLWQRLALADTLVHVDLPLAQHYRWVLKRFVMGHFTNPEGWPERSRIWQGTWSSLRVVGLCHRELTPRYRDYVAQAAATRQVHRLHSSAEIATFLRSIESQAPRP